MNVQGFITLGFAGAIVRGTPGAPSGSAAQELPPQAPQAIAKPAHTPPPPPIGSAIIQG